MWGRVGVSDPDFGFGPEVEVDCGSESESSGPGRTRMEGGTVGIPEHWKGPVGQDQNSGVVPRNRKQARQRWRRWRRLTKLHASC